MVCDCLSLIVKKLKNLSFELNNEYLKNITKHSDCLLTQYNNFEGFSVLLV